MDAHIHFQLGHVGINVTDLARSKAFYMQLLGLKVLGESTDGDKRFALLGYEQGSVLTLWQQSSGRFDSSTPGLHHLSFKVGSLAEVQAVQVQLLAQGAKFLHDGIVSHAEGRDSGGIYFEDPDGTRLEVFSPSGLAGTAPAKAGHLSCGFF